MVIDSDPSKKEWAVSCKVNYHIVAGFTMPEGKNTKSCKFLVRKGEKYRIDVSWKVDPKALISIISVGNPYSISFLPLSFGL